MDSDAIVEILNRIPSIDIEAIRAIEKALREGVRELNIDELTDIMRMINKLKRKGARDFSILYIANRIEDLIKSQLNEETVRDILRRSSRRVVEA